MRDPADKSSQSRFDISHRTGKIREKSKASAFSSRMYIIPSRDISGRIVYNVWGRCCHMTLKGSISYELLGYRTGNSRGNFMVMLEEAQPALPPAIIKSRGGQGA